MISRVTCSLAAITLIAISATTATTTTALAQQESTNRVNSNSDWSVFVEDNPTQCWIVSAEKESVNTRDGRVVAARRGDIRLFVSFWPQSEKKGEVSFTGGYPFRPGSTVSMQIGNSTFELFTDNELAWAASPADDAKIITAMKRGSSAILSGVSGRGTATRDTFSLLGFTASLEDAEKRCG
jgi:hypothetical protein